MTSWTNYHFFHENLGVMSHMFKTNTRNYVGPENSAWNALWRDFTYFNGDIFLGGPIWMIGTLENLRCFFSERGNHYGKTQGIDQRRKSKSASDWFAINDRGKNHPGFWWELIVVINLGNDRYDLGNDHNDRGLSWELCFFTIQGTGLGGNGDGKGGKVVW